MSWETKIPKFRRFVLQNFPFIEKDFDALTDYQLISKVVEYLNNVINSQNQLISEVENFETNITSDFNRLENLFIELKSYVDNYFDNLDVQQEINNKLDAMVEAGTLQEIIADYLNSKAIFGFDNVSDMADSTNLINGSYARTLGYTARNDGGDGLYRIRTVTNDDINNPFVIEMADDTLVAELVHYKTINILQLGAKTDGSTDISSLVNELIGTYDVFIPQGTFLVNNPINITRNGTILKCEGTLNIGNNICININASDCKIDINKISNGSYEGTAVQLKSTTADQNSLNYNNVRINTIYRTSKGFALVPDYKGVQYSKFDFNLIEASDCIYFTTGTFSGDTGWVNENTFTGGRCMGTNGVHMVKGAYQSDPFNNNKFYNIAFEEIGNPIIIENGTTNCFTNMRMLESITGTYHISCDDTSNSNQFIGTIYLYTTRIYDTNTSRLKPNIYAPIRNATGDIATTCKYVGGKPIIPNQMWQTDTMTNIYNQDTHTVDRDCYYNDMLISIGVDSDKTCVVSLPNTFGDGGVTSFYVRISYRGTNSSITIKDSSNNDVMTNNDISSDLTANISNKYFKVFKMNSSLTLTGTNNKWLVVPIN